MPRFRAPRKIDKFAHTHTHIHENKNTHNLSGATRCDEFKESHHLKYGHISYQSYTFEGAAVMRGKAAAAAVPENIACRSNARITNGNLVVVKLPVNDTKIYSRSHPSAGTVAFA